MRSWRRVGARHRRRWAALSRFAQLEGAAHELLQWCPVCLRLATDRALGRPVRRRRCPYCGGDWRNERAVSLLAEAYAPAVSLSR